MVFAVFGDQLRQSLAPDTIQCRVGQHGKAPSIWFRFSAKPYIEEPCCSTSSFSYTNSV
jgi:hypothetical protein